MTVPISELISRLKHLSKLRTAEERERFQETMIEIGRRRDPAVIDELLRVIDDSVEDRQTMTELWRVLEKEYAPSVFVPALLRNLLPMLAAAPESTFYLHARVLNDRDPASYAQYLDGLEPLSATERARLRELLGEVDAAFPERLERVRRLLSRG